MPEFSVESARSDEGSYVSFVVRLSEPAAADVTVAYQTYDATALGSVDYNETAGLLRFVAGETTKTVNVYARPDTLVEADEAFELELFNPVGADFGPHNLALRTIGWSLDTDIGGGQRRVAVATPIVNEGNGTADFLVSLSEAFATSTTLDFATLDGSALAGEDFVARSGEVTFAAGQTEATVSIRLENDRKVEPGETFGLKVDGAGISATGLARVLDDDGRQPLFSIEGGESQESGYMTFTVRLSEPAPAAVTVDYQTFDGSALGGLDYNETSGTLTFQAGETSKTLSVYARSDTLAEPDEAFELEIFNPVGAGFGGRNHSLRATGEILDDDAGGGQRSVAVSSPIVLEGKGTAVFTVSLSEAFTEEKTLRFATVDGSAHAGSDFVRTAGRLTFAEGQTEASVSVDLKNDRKVEPGETFALKVKGAGVAGAGQASILNDDGARRILSVEGESAQEGDYMTFAVRLSKAAKSDVTVDYQTLAGTALGNIDFNSASNSLTFQAGETMKTVKIYARSDVLSESDEAFRFELSNPSGVGFAKGDVAPSALAFIHDDDPGFQKRVLAVSDVRVSESGGDADFTIGLSRALDEDLVVRFKTQNGSAKAGKDFVAEKGKVTISAGSTEAVVSVKVRDDNRKEPLENLKLKITSFDHGEFAPSGHDSQATAYIVDDDARGRLALHDDMLF